MFQKKNSLAILSESLLCIVYDIYIYLIQSVFLENQIYSAPVPVRSDKKLHYPPGNHCPHGSDWLWRHSATHVTSQIPYRGNGAWHIAVGYVAVRSFQSVEIVNCRRFVDGLVSSASLDQLVLFRRQFTLGNNMSKMPRLMF